MNAIVDRVIVLNLIANTVIFYVAARLYLFPLIQRVSVKQILVPILLLHSTRHLGMMFLTRGATYPELPQEFAYPAAFGDLITAIIAFAAIPLVLRGSAFAKANRLDIQHFRHSRSARRDYNRDDLQCAGGDGTGVLDPGRGGTAAIGDSLRDLCSSRTSLGELSPRFEPH